jgi:hypothetical protein
VAGKGKSDERENELLPQFTLPGSGAQRGNLDCPSIHAEGGCFGHAPLDHFNIPEINGVGCANVFRRKECERTSKGRIRVGLKAVADHAIVNALFIGIKLFHETVRFNDEA